MQALAPVLLLDTCGHVGTIALATKLEPGSQVLSIAMPGRSASERLVASVRELVGSAGISVSALGLIAVVHGPGSFTGVRVGVSAAKGLCEALGLPVVAISRLAVLAEAGGTGRVLSVLDAGRGEFYCGLYEGGSSIREALLTREEIDRLAAGARVVVCEPQVAEALAELQPILVEAPTAAAGLALVLRRVEAGQFDDLATLDANYLRRTDAEILLKRQAARAGR